MPIIAILLVIAAFIGGAYLVPGKNQNSPKPEATTVSPTSAPTPTLVETTQKEKVTTSLVPTNDPDPIVDCNFKYVGTKKIRSSECSKSFECQIGGQWYIYTSKEQCSQDQTRDTSTKWSEYRASKIKDLQGALKIINDQIVSYENEYEKLKKTASNAIYLYENNLITQSEYDSLSKRAIEAEDYWIKEMAPYLKELYTRRDKHNALLKRFENGENVSPEEYKAILGL